MPQELDRHLIRQRQVEQKIANAAVKWAAAMETVDLLAEDVSIAPEIHADALDILTTAENDMRELVHTLRGVLAGRRAVMNTRRFKDMHLLTGTLPTPPEILKPLSAPLLEPKPYEEMAAAWRAGTLDNPIAFDQMAAD